jgi:hypothetical protein
MSVLPRPFPQGPPWRENIARYVDGEADITEQNGSGYLTAKTRTRALRLTAEWIRTLDPEDHRLILLAECQRYPGAAKITDAYRPGREARMVWAHLGHDIHEIPSPPDLLAEVCARSVVDQRVVTLEYNSARAQQRETELIEQVKVPFEQAVAKAQDEATAATEKMHLAEGQLQDVRLKYDAMRAERDALEEVMRLSKSEPEPAKPKAVEKSKPKPKPTKSKAPAKQRKAPEPKPAPAIVQSETIKLPPQVDFSMAGPLPEKQ